MRLDKHESHDARDEPVKIGGNRVSHNESEKEKGKWLLKNKSSTSTL